MHFVATNLLEKSSRQLPQKAPSDSTWLNPFGPLTTKAAKAAKLSAEESKPYSLLYTYSLIIALVCGTAGLPHILVRFYTNPDGVAAKRTTMWVMILIGVFYVFPPVFGVMGRNLLPELYSGVGAKGTDKVVLELPRILNSKTEGSSREGGEGSEAGEGGKKLPVLSGRKSLQPTCICAERPCKSFSGVLHAALMALESPWGILERFTGISPEGCDGGEEDVEVGAHTILRTVRNFTAETRETSAESQRERLARTVSMHRCCSSPWTWEELMLNTRARRAAVIVGSDGVRSRCVAGESIPDIPDLRR